MITLRDNFYWQEQHNLDLTALADSCKRVVNYANTSLKGTALDPMKDNALIGDVYNAYNLLAYPLPGIAELYKAIHTSWSQLNQGPGWWIKSWANVYENREYHPWHQHKTHIAADYDSHKPTHASYHGIFCISGIDSVTSYRNAEKTIHIHQQPNQLTFVPNRDDWFHRSWPYPGPEVRITVAFNILHISEIDPFRYANHWLPLA